MLATNPAVWNCFDCVDCLFTYTTVRVRTWLPGKGALLASGQCWLVSMGHASRQGVRHCWLLGSVGVCVDMHITIRSLHETHAVPCLMSRTLSLGKRANKANRRKGQNSIKVSTKRCTTPVGILSQFGKVSRTGAVNVQGKPSATS